MTANDGSHRAQPRLYRRTWLWVALAAAALPIAYAVGLGDDLAVQARFLSVVAVAVMGLLPVGLWMGALVSPTRWVRGFLAILTVIALALLLWATWNTLRSIEDEMHAGCLLVETDEGDVVQTDPDLCERVDTFDMLERNTWILVALFWVAPLFVLYALRRHFEPAEPASKQEAVV